jgi:hypothetical protein
MATRISVLKNVNGQIAGWICKHTNKAPQAAESNGQAILCSRCASAVRNGAELRNDDNGQLIEPTQVTVGAQVKRAAAGK